MPNRSTLVAPIDVQSSPKYVEAPDIAQRMITRLAAELRSKDDLQGIARFQKEFMAGVKAGNHLAMSEANMAFHMTIVTAGRNPFPASFYERLLGQGWRMLHLHFDFIEKGYRGSLLTEEQDEMLDAIELQDADRADRLAHAVTRQFRDNFVNFMKAGHLASVQVATWNKVVSNPEA